MRFGSAEIYNIVNATNLPWILDSLCVGQNTEDGERVVLFLKMAGGFRFKQYVFCSLVCLTEIIAQLIMLLIKKINACLNREN